VVPAITAANWTQNHSDSTWATYRESAQSRNYRKQPYWALHTYCGKC